MCSIWEQNSGTVVTLDQYRTIFSSRSLAGVTNLSLTGGEPTLRKDLQDIVVIAMDSFPRLTQLSLNSNGFAPALLEKQVQKILSVQGSKCQLSVGLSFDGIDKVHDKVRGVQGAFSRLSDSISRLESLRKSGSLFGLSLRCTITTDNVHQIRDIYSYCCRKRWPIIFAVASAPDAYISAEGKRDLFALDEEKLESCRVFFLEMAPNNAYYSRAADYIKNRRRTFGCIGAERRAVLILPDGDVMPCGERSRLLLGNINDQPFDEIWTGEQARKVFSTIRQDACVACPSQCYPTEKRLSDDIKPLLKAILPAPVIKSLQRLKLNIPTAKR